MGVTLSKGQKVDLTKAHPGLQHVVVGLGWDVGNFGASYDLDASAFLTGANGKVASDADFVFYNNPSGGNGSILYSGDNRTGSGHQDDEQIQIDLNLVPQTIHRIAFTITIHDAHMKQQNFGQVANAYVRIFNTQTFEELIRFELGRDFTVETAIVAAELYRHNGEWKFNAIASGFQGGLSALCRNFGVNVDDAPTPTPIVQQPYQQQPIPSQQQQQGFGNQQGGFGNSNTNTYGHQPQHQQQPTYQPPMQNQAQRGGASQQYGSEELQCPRCHSTNVRTGQKGFGLGKAAVGGLILGPVGLLGGFIGKNKLKLTCNSCGNSWSPNQTDYSEWAVQQKRKAQDLFARYKSQDVLDAIVAGCALVSMADGHLDPSERQQMIDFVNQSEELRVFDTNKVITQFNNFTQKIERDMIVGRAEAFKALGRVRTKPEIARLIARYSIAIGYADGNFDANEQRVVSEVCRELGLNPAEFLS
ncbi:TerD family protein [Peribacillus sp. NPDC096379]|uniref:TerD family protein n=1 Tax=Peribacillus sp. NPDC096379 TaxID=3364393 RepID=UPI003819969A